LIEEISDGEETIGIIVHGNPFKEKVHFITPPSYAFQVGFMRYADGDSAEPHMHPNIERTIQQSHEFIHVLKGRMKVDFYNASGKKIASKIIGRGSSVFFIRGGRGWISIGESELFEIKQGPYLGDRDKILIKEETR